MSIKITIEGMKLNVAIITIGLLFLVNSCEDDQTNSPSVGYIKFNLSGVSKDYTYDISDIYSGTISNGESSISNGFVFPIGECKQVRIKRFNELGDYIEIDLYADTLGYNPEWISNLDFNIKIVNSDNSVMRLGKLIAIAPNHIEVIEEVSNIKYNPASKKISGDFNYSFTSEEGYEPLIINFTGNFDVQLYELIE